MLMALKIPQGTILIIVAGTVSKTPAETFEVQRNILLTVSLAKQQYNAERVLKIII
jgi:hypothetical protein